MKVQLDGNRLVRVSKTLPLDEVDGESMGIMLFRKQGGRLFRAALEQAIRKTEAFKQGYLSVIDTMARSGLVWTQSMRGLEWTEIDTLADLEYAQAVVPRWAERPEYLQMLA
jgi:choline kinase